MSLAPPINLMVGIPPIKMVMNGAWFMALLYQHYRKWPMERDLVGGIPTPLKNMKVSWDDDIPNMWENKKCSKPPARDDFPIKIYVVLFI